MSSQALPKFQRFFSAYFLHPDIHPKHYIYRGYITQPPFIRAGSIDDAIKKVKDLQPTEILRNVLLKFGIVRQEKRPEGNMCTITEGTNFSHPEVTVEQFSELVRCCRSEEATSLDGVRTCWNRVFPGSLSAFNLNVASKDALDPLVRANFDKFHPSKI